MAAHCWYVALRHHNDHRSFRMTQSFLGRRHRGRAAHLASEAALRVLRDGGNALEAMIAAAASIAVVTRT
jgi:hypothetical protein